MNKPTIWILNHYAMTPDLPGGTRHFDIAKELVRRGYKVLIIAASYIHWCYKDLKLAPGVNYASEDYEGVRFLWLRTIPYRGNDWRRHANMVSYMIRSYRLGRRLSKVLPDMPAPHIIIGSSVHLLAPVSAYWLARFYRARFVLEVRDLWPQTLIDMGKMSATSATARFLSRLEKYLYRKAEKIVVVPPFAADYIAGLGIPRDKVVWVPNAVDMNRYTRESTGESAHEDLTVAYVGTLGETNGVEMLLEAASLLRREPARRIAFDIVGDGPEKPTLLKMKESLGLDNVRFHAPVPKTEVPGRLSRADILVHIEKDIPNLVRYGSSPNKLYDYLAAGKPLIVASHFVSDDINGIGCGIKLEHNTPEALAEAIRDVSGRTKNERVRMGELARGYVGKNFSTPVVVGRLESQVLCADSDLARKFAG